MQRFLLVMLGVQLQGFGGSSSSSSSSSRPFWEASLLSCEDTGLHFLLTPEPKVVSSKSTVRLLDPRGDPHLLKNDSTCGTWVAPNPDGSMVVKAAVGGCYVKAQGGSYRTTVQIEGPGADGRKTSYKEELRCPEPLLALDKPGPSLCSGVRAADKLLCGSGTVPQAECEALGCCYSPRDRLAPCYYAHKVTAHCTPDGRFSVAISRNATFPPLRLDSVHLVSSQGQAGCLPISRTPMFTLFQFPLSACGTTFKEMGSQRVYENELLADREVMISQSGSITRDSEFRLTVRCSYSAEDSLPLGVQVAALPPPAAIAQRGPLTLEMRIAQDETYTSYFADADYPVVKVLREPVHLEVRLLGREDPALVLLLHDCWATPSANPLQKPDWSLLEAGCPYRGDNYQTRRVPVGADVGLPFPSHYQRFVVSTFTFVDDASRRMLTGPVYFHCSASACVPSGQESCHLPCDATAQWRSRRSAEGSSQPEEWWTLVTSRGPVAFFHHAAEGLIPSGSGMLQEGRMQWDDALSLVAGVVALLAVATMASVVLQRRWGRGGPGEGRALSSA
nr:zona pellucida sperm-binding protein 4-like [Pogona vitticeps]